MTASSVVGEDGAGQVVCSCCGRTGSDEDVVRLGNHPEIAVCLRCAHWLHQQARGREDADRRFSPTARVRDGLRAARRLVMRRNWQHAPVIGRVLRWLGPRLP